MEVEEFVITIKGPSASKLIEAICSTWRYREHLADGSDNPESKNDFTVRKIKGLLSKITELSDARKIDVLELSKS
jgi:hypothetical protein